MRILVAGSSRSGSIWTARMLAAGAGSRCIVEPDNVNASRAVVHGHDDFRPFPVLRPGTVSPGYTALWRLAFAGRVPGRAGWTHPLSRLVLGLPRPVRDRAVSAAAAVIGSAPRRPHVTVVQTVMAHFAIEWIADSFDPRVVVIQRDPLNMVSSWLEWNVSGFDLATRPEIRDRCDELGIHPPPFGATPTARAAWWVGLLTEALGTVAARHPDWIVVSHEALCAGPEAEFRQLYEALDIPWTSAADRFLGETGYILPNRRSHRGQGPSLGDAASVRAQVARKWRVRLSQDQVLEARSVLAGFPSRGWVAPPALLDARPGS